MVLMSCNKKIYALNIERDIKWKLENIDKYKLPPSLVS